MYIQLNAGAGQAIGVDLVRKIMSLGYDGNRQDIPFGAPMAHVRKLYRELDRAGAHATLIVGGWMGWEDDDGSVQSYKEEKLPVREAIEYCGKVVAELMRFDLINRCWLEIGNEPDVTKQWSKDPDGFASFVSMMSAKAIQTAPALERRCVVGGVSNLRRKDGFKYLSRLLTQGRLNNHLIVGLHPYRSEVRPWEKFDDWARINDAVWQIKQRLHGKRFAVTEVGWHTATQHERKWLGRKGDPYQWTDDEVAEFYLWERDFWLREGAEVFVWYNLNDGPDDTSEHKFGIRRMEPPQWEASLKPVAHVVKEVPTDA